MDGSPCQLAKRISVETPSPTTDVPPTTPLVAQSDSSSPPISARSAEITIIHLFEISLSLSLSLSAGHEPEPALGQQQPHHFPAPPVDGCPARPCSMSYRTTFISLTLCPESHTGLVGSILLVSPHPQDLDHYSHCSFDSHEL